MSPYAARRTGRRAEKGTCSQFWRLAHGSVLAYVTGRGQWITHLLADGDTGEGQRVRSQCGLVLWRREAYVTDYPVEVLADCCLSPAWRPVITEARCEWVRLHCLQCGGVVIPGLRKKGLELDKREIAALCDLGVLEAAGEDHGGSYRLAASKEGGGND